MLNTLDHLIEKYELDRWTPNYRKWKKAVTAIRECLQNEKKVYLVTNSTDSKEHFEADIADLQITVCGELVFSPDIESVDVTTEADATIILLYREESVKLKKIAGIQANKVINIYAILKENSLLFDAPYYHVLEEQDYYKQIYLDKRRYLNTENTKDKQIYLEKLIFDYIYIHDFRYAMKYINEYIQKEYENKERYKAFLEELRCFLDEVKRVLHEKMKKHIIIHWVDALRYEEIEETNFLRRNAENSLFFTNAYTVSPWTRATMKTMFCKKKMVDGHQFEIGELDVSNSILLNEIEKQGYSFCYVGYAKSDVFHRQYVSKNYVPRPIAGVYWSGIEDILNNDKPTVYLIHSVYETHSPYMNGEYEGENYTNSFDEKMDESQLASGRDYADTELEFYVDMYGDAKLDIYMSDHGKLNDLYHTMLYIKGIESRWQIDCDKMFSLYDFFELFCFLMTPCMEKWNKMFHGDIISVQDTDRYNYSLYILTGKCNIRELLGYRGALCKEGIFIRRNDGKESFLIPNDKHNYINEESYQKIISQLRDYTGTYMIDINKYDFFKVSRYIHRAIANYNTRMKRLVPECERIMQETLERLNPNASIAIRGGGEHTERLLDLMCHKYNVTYIIDQKSEVGKIFNVPVIRPEEVREKDIDVVLISSFKYHQVMCNEMKQALTSTEIIDFYELFVEKGLQVGQPFYGDEVLEPIDCVGVGFEEFGYKPDFRMQIISNDN